MKTYILFSLVFLFTVTIQLHSQSDKTPWIKVNGNTFVDEDGRTLVFRGLNSSDPDKLESEGQWKQSYFNEISNWGSNIVRFPVHPEAWRERGVDNYLKLLDDGIEMAAKAGLYVIIDWHSIGNLKSGIFHHERYNTTLAETYNFWKIMAENYGGNSRVAFFELFNEPTLNENKFGSCSWDEWKEIIEEIILIVRSNGAKNIPLVAGFNWAYDLTEINENPINAEGIAYVSHPYPQKRQKPWEDKWENDWGYVAKKYPVILTEIGFCTADAEGAHIPVIDDGSYVQSITNYCESRGISYVIWVFDPNWSPMLIKNWKFETTPAGSKWKDYLTNKK